MFECCGQNSPSCGRTENDIIFGQNFIFEPRPVYEMSDKFHREDQRLMTFDAWPLTWMDKNLLALTGLFYTGRENIVQCYFCDVKICNWHKHDQPFFKHLALSPNCPLLTRHTTNNIPRNHDAFDRIVPFNGYRMSNPIDIPKRKQEMHDVVKNVTFEQKLANIFTKSGSSTILRDKACKICYVREYNTVFLPCGHVLACQQCSANLKRCPICRNRFENVVRIYLS